MNELAISVGRHGVVATGTDRPAHLWLAPGGYRGVILAYGSDGDLVMWRELTEAALLADHRLVHVTGDAVIPAPDPVGPATADPQLADGSPSLPVRGVLSLSQDAALAAAEVASRLGLPGHGLDAVQALRDRGSTRRALAGHVRIPAARRADSLAQARDAAGVLGYPLTVAPRERARGRAWLVCRAWHLAALYRRAESQAGPDRAVIVQAARPEVSATLWCLTRDGHTHVLAARRALRPRRSCGCISGYLVDADDHIRRDAEVRRAVTVAAAALGVRDGLTRMDVQLDAQGPMIADVAAGCGGASDTRLVRLATGLDMSELSIGAALGAPCEPLADRDFRCSMQVVLHPAAIGAPGRARLANLTSMPWAQQVCWTRGAHHLCPEVSAPCPAPVATVIVAGWDPGHARQLAAVARAEFTGAARV